MGKLDDFDLDVKVKINSKKGIKPSYLSLTPKCTSLCPTNVFVCK